MDLKKGALFSGTLNPALQDRNGQPKRDITTIIHILNDLLCAQYKNYSATATASTSARSAKATSANSKSTNTADIHSSQNFGENFGTHS
jgi:hypothetical protein